jgi:hypothetical protein
VGAEPQKAPDPFGASRTIMLIPARREKHDEPRWIQNGAEGCTTAITGP